MIREISITWSRPPGMMRRSYDAAVRLGWERIGVEWWKRYLPQHFWQTAYRRYGYAGRTMGYSRRKQKHKRHNLPLTWSGELKRSSLMTAQIRVSRNRATVRFGRGTQALNFAGSAKAKRKNYPDLRSELTAVLPEELERLAGIMIETIAEEFNAGKRTLGQRRKANTT